MMKHVKLTVLRALFVIIISALFFTACGKKEEEKPNGDSKSNLESQETSEVEESSEKAEETQNGEFVRPEDAFIPNFKEQIIYDKDGITITARPDDGEKTQNMDVFPGATFILEIHNDTDDVLSPYFEALTTKDGLTTSAYADIAFLGDRSEHTLIMNLDMFTGNVEPGFITLFKRQNMGNTLGDFRLKLTMTETKDYEHKHIFWTDFVKTEDTDVLPDYSLVHTKPLIYDENDIKIYHVDTFLSPAYQVPFFGEVEERYRVILFIENNRDKDVQIYFDDEVWKKDEETTFSGYHSISVYAHGKTFYDLDATTEELTKAGVDKVESLTFAINSRERLGEDEKESLGTSEPIVLTFPEGFPVVNYGD